MAIATLVPQCGTFEAQDPSMQIHLNGEPRVVEPAMTLAALLERAGLAGRRVAVEVNGTIVPRSRHPEHALTDGDRIEVVHALGGG